MNTGVNIIINVIDVLLIVLINYYIVMFHITYYNVVCLLGLKRRNPRDSWMANELATILHKLEQDTDERADEREKKRLIIEKEEERKRLILEAELEEKKRAQERNHEMEMQSMMFGFLQQMHNPPLYGHEPSSHAVNYPPNFMPHQSPSGNHMHDDGDN